MGENNPNSKPYNFLLSLHYHLLINKIHEKAKKFHSNFQCDYHHR